MNPEIESMSEEQVIELRTRLDIELKERKTAKFRKELENLIRQGVTIADFKAVANSLKKKSSAKYRNPNNHEQTWVGKGKPPDWFKQQLDAGKNKEDMLIS
jgi:DNA-binding protein H-NS